MPPPLSGPADTVAAPGITLPPVFPAPAPGDTAGAAEAPQAAPRVGRVSVTGNAAVDSTRILRTFDVPSGSRYSNDAVGRGIRKLFALGLFQDVSVERVDRGAVVDLVIRVEERPHLSAITFSGNKKLETSELEKKLFLKVGDAYDPARVQTQVDTLLKQYREEGYARAEVQPNTETHPDGRVALTFQIREGEKMRIRRIQFDGARAFSAKQLKKRLKTKTKGFFGGGEVRDEDQAEDRQRLIAFYRSKGYRDVQVLGQDLQPGERSNALVYAIRLDEGRFYRLGDIAWSGNRIVSTETVTRLSRIKPGQAYDASAIERIQGGAYAEYAEHGYLYVGIEPREVVRDSLVDVTFVVTEGRPSDVRYVVISGNRGTREKVIRREIDLHEGDRFKRSALVRTQGDIMRLGLFEDVAIDFAPAESTDVDIHLKVKEKQVGTASAGAGYTSESGLTGFLELGHNNVMGNGQSLSLHLERGGKRSDYFLSFTEPWFRDTPTLLGFSVFNTQRDRDLYEEQRLGGSGSIGRPLPWPDYTRGSMTYRLENVTITQLGTQLTPQDSIALAGVRVGEGVLTSSLELGLLRNSTNSAFYPTAGSRVSLNHELAGGPFGGAIHFHKHRLEGRTYLRSLFKGVTTMVRGRLGLLGKYADQNSDEPPYERFRLGGGTTTDPLRGYDDYQVVPAKYIQRVLVRTDSTRVVTGPDTTYIVTPIFDTVRYPGGHYMGLFTVEQQFPIVHPLRGVVFFDAGNTWDTWREIQPFDLKLGAGAGFRLEIPLLGNIGFDYGYGFNRDDGPRAKGHFLIGNFNF